MRTVQKYTALWLALLLLLPLLIACGKALGTPTAENLMSFLCEDFTCGFTVAEANTESASAAFVRETACDTLTYEKNGVRVTFRFADGESYLCTAKSEMEEALNLPVALPETHGAARIQALFSILPSDGTETTVRRTAEGYALTLTYAEGAVTWVFSTEFVPLSVACGDTALIITSFSKNT